MTKIENREQYEWAVARVEQLLPLVTDETPRIIFCPFHQRSYMERK